jgi:hypothetical protein
VVVEVVRKWPGESRRERTPDVVRDRGKGNAERGTHLSAAEFFAEAQPKDISDLSHGDTGSGHGLLLGRDLSEETAEQVLPHASASGVLLTGVYENVGIAVRIRSERVYEMARNPHFTS